MNTFVFAFLLFAMIGAFHCRPKDTNLDYERHNQYNIFGMTFNTSKKIYRTNTFLARVLGLFVPRDTEVQYQRVYRYGIPGVLEVKGHKAIGLENYESDDYYDYY